MAAITQVKIEGFQSHVSSNFVLGEGLNVITGPSDAGKTSIIRAVRWVAFNEPQGEAFVNASVGEAIVAIHLDNGVIITKRRRKGKTSYLLQQDQEDEGSLFEKSEVPEEIKHLLQIEKQTFGDFETALNFAFQLDAPFLISETASAGAKILGKLAGTESVDLAIKGVSKDTYGTRQDRANADKDIERIAGSMLAYQHIDDVKEAVEIAEQLMEQIETQHQKFESVQVFRQTYETVLEKLNTTKTTLNKLQDVSQLVKELEGIEKAQQRYEQLKQAQNESLKLNDRMGALDKELDKYKEIQQALDTLPTTEKAFETLTVLKSLDTEYQRFTLEQSKTLTVIEKTKDVGLAADSLQAAEESHKRLSDLKILHYENRNSVERQKTTLERLKTFNGLREGKKLLDYTVVEFAFLEAIYALRADYGALSSDLSLMEDEVVAKEEAVRLAKVEELEAWESAGGICPLCEQPHERGAC